jgi:hypothetical protein
VYSFLYGCAQLLNSVLLLCCRSGSADFHIAETGQMAPAFSYSHSRGLFAGLSLDGSLVMTRSEVNHCFYGRPVTAAELLGGQVPPPRAAAPLYDALEAAQAALPDVHHAGRSAGEGNRRASLSAPKSSASEPTAAAEDAPVDETAQTIRDIDELLAASGYHKSSMSNSRHSVAHSSLPNNPQHRRRTMAAGAAGQQWGSEVVVEDEVWGVNSGLITERSSENKQPSDESGPQQGECDSWVGGGGITSGVAPGDGAAGGQQRSGKARPRSLPETRRDAMDHEYAAAPPQPSAQVRFYPPPPVQQHNVQRPLPSQPQPSEQLGAAAPAGPVSARLSAEDVLGDVPKPQYMAARSTAGGGASVVDEELECVTANVNALL